MEHIIFVEMDERVTIPIAEIIECHLEDVKKMEIDTNGKS